MKKDMQLLLMMVAGIMVGNIIGFGCKEIVGLKWLGYSMVFGIASPFVIELGAISSTVGLQIYISISGVIGLIIALIIYKLFMGKYERKIYEEII